MSEIKMSTVFWKNFKKSIDFLNDMSYNSYRCKFGSNYILWNSVTVARQTLTLFVWVRILVGQQHEENPYSWKTVRVCFLNEICWLAVLLLLFSILSEWFVILGLRDNLRHKRYHFRYHFPALLINLGIMLMYLLLVFYE